MRYVELLPQRGSLSKVIVSHRGTPTQDGSVLLVIQLMNGSIELVPPPKHQHCPIYL